MKQLMFTWVVSIMLPHIKTVNVYLGGEYYVAMQKKKQLMLTWVLSCHAMKQLMLTWVGGTMLPCNETVNAYLGGEY